MRLSTRDWKKIYCMAQRFGSATMIITVSKRERTYKLGVYEPESSSLYEMSLVTSNSSTPLNVLIERCELSPKLDLVLCMHEVAFPHKVYVNLIHLPSQQEFNLHLGDDLVYTMIEYSRKEAFMHFFDQLITWGCIGFHGAVGSEDQVASQTLFEETFPGNQIFQKTAIQDDLPTEQLMASSESGEFKAPMALTRQAPKKLRVPVIRTQLDFLGKRPSISQGLSMHLLYHAEHKFAKEDQTLLMRIHKRVLTNDIAITLRVRSSEALSLPEHPARRDYAAHGAAHSAANGRPFDTPALAAGEGGVQMTEVTLWLQDKCSRAPCGIYGEICEVPSFAKQVIVLVTDEDSPRAIRVAVALAQPPFQVLFQVVLLEQSENTAKVEPALSLKVSASRRVIHQIFHHQQKNFGMKGAHQQRSAVLSHLTAHAAQAMDQELRQKLDDFAGVLGELNSNDQVASEHLGVESGQGPGGPRDGGRRPEADEAVDVSIIHMCTRRKLGRMMVFTVYRDVIAHNMYIRVVMHDPVTQKDSHLTLLHYTTQRLLSILRINRDMLEERREYESDNAKQERQELRAEMGKLIVSHLYVQRLGDKEGLSGEVLDNLEIAEDEELEYELCMRDIMDPSNSSELSVKKRLLGGTADLSASGAPSPDQLGGSPTRALLPTAGASAASTSARGPSSGLGATAQPFSLLEMRESSLLHKAEKMVSGRRVLITFYNETTAEDILSFSHNIRIVVADVQTLNVLACQDFHEDVLEELCARRGKGHLMSATREQDLVLELWECLALQHSGQKITGITFAGID
jgi:hypothetical protein